MEVGRFPNRGKVKFEVSGTDNLTLRSVNHNPQRFWNRVSRTEEGCFKIFKLKFSVLVDFVEFGIAKEAMLFQFSTDQGKGQRSSVDRNIGLFQKEWNPPDVVFVSVSDEDGLDAIDIVYDIRVIRNDIVDSKGSSSGNLIPASTMMISSWYSIP